MRILLKIPSRSRPAQLTRVVQRYLVMASGKHDVRILLSLDDDDPTMKDPAVRARLLLDPRVEIWEGKSRSKVEAYNRDIVPWNCKNGGFDILVGASDDMWPGLSGWDDVIAQDMLEHHPNLDGALWYNDGYRQRTLCTLPVVGYNLFVKTDYLYEPSYISLWCDNQWQELYSAMGRLPYIDKMPIEHRHFTAPPDRAAKRDALYNRNEAPELHRRDEANFKRLRAIRAPNSRLPFGWPEILLSICICTVRGEARAAMLNKLLSHLNMQINSAGDYKSRVEVIVDRDAGEVTIGAKRNRMIHRAQGRFIVFIDDDDWVCDTYVRSIVDAINRDPGLDCVGIEGVMTVDGKDPKTFRHSRSYRGWYEEGGVYYRTPNHWNPVRRQIALEAGFPNIDWGEDHEYSKRLHAQGRIAKEYALPGVTYYYLKTSNSAAEAAARRRGQKVG